MKEITLANLNGHKLSFKLSLPNKAKEERTPLLKQITPQDKDPTVGINDFE